MKKYIYIVILALYATSCTSMLDIDSKTKITSQFTYSTPDGLARAAVALYSEDRTIYQRSESDNAAILLLDPSTDLTLFRAGNAAPIFRLNPNFTASQPNIRDIWKHYYGLIGKANEIIAGAESQDLQNALVKRAYGEAKFFRARSYFELYKKWDRLYLNTEPTTVDNLNRVFTPATTNEIFQLIYDDLDDAMDALDWAAPTGMAGTPESGRVTKAVAKHVKAQAALWLQDWDEAITQCEDIFTLATNHDLMDNTIDCFTGANLGCKENLWVMQFSSNIGGGGNVGTDGSTTGHRISTYTTASTNKSLGYEALEYGGYGWGRIYPNTYLIGLYDKAKDKRYNDLFIHEYRYLTGANAGQVITTTSANYVANIHPMSMKYFDRWTNADLPSRRSGFKDVVVYRLAETYLIASEAYMRKFGGSNDKALTYFNKVWERSGNDKFISSITTNVLLDEYARELHLEGNRWGVLKRFGVLEDRAIQHSGDTRAENPKLNTDYNDVRINFKYYHNYWPIPQAEIDMMGEKNFPQNSGWNF